MEYVIELNLPPANKIFVDSFKGFDDDHLIANYQYRTDVDAILKPKWLNFNNINWDLILYFKKHDLVGQIHTDVPSEYLRKYGTTSHPHPFGINWVWGGDTLFEYWNYEDVTLKQITSGSDNNNLGAVQTFIENKAPFKSYKMLKDRAYLVYGGLPHRVTGFSKRHLLSLRKANFNTNDWSFIIDLFKDHVRK